METVLADEFLNHAISDRYIVKFACIGAAGNTCFYYVRLQLLMALLWHN